MSHLTAKSPSGAPDPRCVTATLCPSASSRCATASPIPRFPPVTRTDRDGLPGAVSDMGNNLTVKLQRASIASPKTAKLGQPLTEPDSHRETTRDEEQRRDEPGAAGVAAGQLIADLLFECVVDLLEFLE